MRRRTDQEIRAAYLERIDKLQQHVRRIDRRTDIQTRKQRNHRLIVGGTLAETHTLKNPRSDYAKLHVGLLVQYARPEDRHLFAELFRAVLPPAMKPQSCSVKLPLRTGPSPFPTLPNSGLRRANSGAALRFAPDEGAALSCSPEYLNQDDGGC